MRLPIALNAFDRSNEQQTRAQIEREDDRNLKRDEDIKLAQGAKLYVRGSDGVYRELTARLVGLNPIDNRFINGDNQIDQRNNGASQTITAGAALAYTIDRWYAYCTGANVTGQRVAGSGADLFRYQFTGAASVTKIGFATRIEARDCADLSGGSATIALETSNSLLTTVTWTAWYANSTDAFGTLASPTRTLIATGTFTVTSTLATYTATISVPAAANTGIEVEFSVGAQTSGTWVIGKRAIVKGAVWPGFCPRSFQQELALCQRYYWRESFASGDYVTVLQAFSTSGAFGVVRVFPIPMRAAATAGISSATHLSAFNSVASSSPAFTGGSLQATDRLVRTNGLTGSSGLVGGNATVVIANTATWIDASAEL